MLKISPDTKRKRQQYSPEKDKGKVSTPSNQIVEVLYVME